MLGTNGGEKIQGNLDLMVIIYIYIYIYIYLFILSIKSEEVLLFLVFMIYIKTHNRMEINL